MAVGEETPRRCGCGKRRGNGVHGPLNCSNQAAVMAHVKSKTYCASVLELLWKLVLVCAQSNARLRSEIGIKDPDSPESRLIKLLLRGKKCIRKHGETKADKENSDEETTLLSPRKLGPEASRGRLEKLLLAGKQNEAVAEALSTQDFAMALLIASICDREAFRRTAQQFAEVELMRGSPLRTFALILSSKAQTTGAPLDGAKSMFDDIPTKDLHETWRSHLATIISNRPHSWEKIVTLLGDRLLEAGEIHAAHCCYMVSGCPVAATSSPGARFALVGADHLVPMDLALMSDEGIEAFELTEAYEWAKKHGNPRAAIYSLQPLKLKYTHLLADMGYKHEAALYVEDIRACAGLEKRKETAEQRSGAPATVPVLLANHVGFATSLNAFGARLSGESKPNAHDKSSTNEFPTLIGRKNVIEPPEEDSRSKPLPDHDHCAKEFLVNTVPATTPKMTANVSGSRHSAERGDEFKGFRAGCSGSGSGRSGGSWKCGRSIKEFFIRSIQSGATIVELPDDEPEVYYDKELQMWVFPEESSAKEATTLSQQLAALMAPPFRVPAMRGRAGTQYASSSSKNERTAPTAPRQTLPRFATFKPQPTADENQNPKRAQGVELVV